MFYKLFCSILQSTASDHVADSLELHDTGGLEVECILLCSTIETHAAACDFWKLRRAREFRHARTECVVYVQRMYIGYKCALGIFY
jgi:hypothetical protein